METNNFKIGDRVSTFDGTGIVVDFIDDFDENKILVIPDSVIYDFANGYSFSEIYKI